MKCPKCTTQMVERKGKFGNFKFCPNQATCGQSTISEASYQGLGERATDNFVATSEDILSQDLMGENLMLEADLLEQSLGPLFAESPDDEPFVNELGEELDCHGELVEHWRPY